MSGKPVLEEISAPQAKAAGKAAAASRPNAILAFANGEYPYETRMSRRSYEARKAKLQAELLKVQIWAQETGQRFVLIFEGRDAAGKGGTIKRFTEHLNPRSARVVALNKPTWEEKGQWYFQRYIQELPTVGEMVFYDRSWYNRGSGSSNTGSRSRRRSRRRASPRARPIR